MKRARGVESRFNDKPEGNNEVTGVYTLAKYY